MKNSLILLFVLCFFSCLTFAKTKIAVLPFSNLDGNSDHNKYCYDLQDSLTKAFIEIDPDNEYIVVVPFEEVDELLNDYNIEANSPTFDTDKWKIKDDLGCDRIISGTFRIVANRFLINSYIYYPDTQITDMDFQAKDIFKKEDKILEAVPAIVKSLYKAFTQ